MHRLFAAVLVIGGLAVLPAPETAGAQQKSVIDCINDAVESCDKDFEGNDVYMAAIRGYCYMIRTAICYTMEQKTE